MNPWELWGLRGLQGDRPGREVHYRGSMLYPATGGENPRQLSTGRPGGVVGQEVRPYTAETTLLPPPSGEVVTWRAIEPQLPKLVAIAAGPGKALVVNPTTGEIARGPIPRAVALNIVRAFG